MNTLLMYQPIGIVGLIITNTMILVLVVRTIIVVETRLIPSLVQ